MDQQTFERLKRASNVLPHWDVVYEIQNHGGLDWVKAEVASTANSLSTKFLTFYPTYIEGSVTQSSILMILYYSNFSFKDSSRVEVMFRNSFEGIHEVIIRIDLDSDDFDLRFSRGRCLGLLGENRTSEIFEPYCFFESAIDSLNWLASPWSDLSRKVQQAWAHYKELGNANVLPVPQHYYAPRINSIGSMKSF